MHREKTLIAYCKDAGRKEVYPIKSFDFLGFTFRPRRVKTKRGKLSTSFVPGVSKKALKEMNKKTRNSRIRNRTDLNLKDISRLYNQVLRGWFNYYGQYYPSALAPLWRHFNNTLVLWAMKKYKKLKGNTKATKMLKRIALNTPKLFVHWEKGIIDLFT